jgi:hypothetical protein
MDWLQPVIEWVKNSVALAVTIWMSSALFVFTPLSGVVAKYQPLPLVLFVFSSIYLGVWGTGALGKKASALFKRDRAKRRLRDQRVNSLYGLGREEKDVLRLFIGRQMRTIPSNRLERQVMSTANELVRRRILRSDGNWLTRRDAAFTTEEWAWEHLNENPHLLDY